MKRSASLLAAALALAACASTPTAAPRAAVDGAEIQPSSRPAPIPALHYRIERLGRRIGWLRHEVRYELRDGEEVLVERVVAETAMAREGVVLPFKGEEERIYEAGGKGRLLTAWVRRTRSDGTREALARCDPSGCDVSVQGDGPRVTRRLPPTAETSVQAIAALVAAKEGEAHFAYLDLDELREEARDAVAKGTEAVRAAGGREAVRVELRTPGDVEPTVEWIATDGTPLAARFSDGAELVVTTEAEAKRAPEPLEISSLAILPLPSAVDRSRPVGTVRITLEALPEAARFPAPHRKYEELPDGAVRITTTTRPPPRTPLPIDPAGFERELAVTADIDHDHPDIRGLVARIPKDRVESAVELAAACLGLVDRLLPTREGAGVDRASQILRAGKGGPDDAARLYVALARAAGLPARIVAGYVYAEDDGMPILVWTAWVEVWTGEWIEVDPFLRELPASPAHLPVGREGVGDGGFGLLGRLGVRAFEALPGGDL